MSVRSAASLMIMAGIMCSVAALAGQAGDPPPAELSYTDEQSTRGGALYVKSCGFCHEDKSLAPLLQGETFLKNWSGKTVGALFTKVQTTMPLNDPGSVSEADAVDLVAYLLKVNHFSSGHVPLPKDAAALNGLELSLKD